MTPKGVNAKQHFHRHSSRRYGNLPASYMVAHCLGVAGKPYSDELVKACIVNAIMCIHSGKENEYSSIPLSRDTVQRRQYNIADQLKHSLRKMVNNEGSLFSLVVDESTDIADSAQLLIFVRSLSPSFELCKSIISMETLATRTRGEDVFLAIKRACIKFGVDFKNLRGICTDGTPAMVGKVKGLVARFSNYVFNEHGDKQLINLHCIIHQETLCSKLADLDNILKDVNHIILFVRANAPHHRQFLEILRAEESSAEDIRYHSEVRSLSQGETSHRALLLRKEIVEFYFSKNNDCPLQNSSFLISLAFLVDLLSHVNHLHHHHVNQALQGRTASVCLLFQKVQDFSILIDSKDIRPDDIPTNSFSGVIDVL
ncbi:General transcription factor II-I repeat domain-containing protein 2 [Trichinella zimbabwensis]|uniref:General transcription factor II-I repeat domain-containing protein 2 n=1 Tax=Trichinella zimbabwensis TaxID=268475 RepID=A0A0V1H680_9BILA|nr:General transcription factor II-I repeat domain-containing protein 2 [Trichinella zimbabwensis]